MASDYFGTTDNCNNPPHCYDCKKKAVKSTRDSQLHNKIMIMATNGKIILKTLIRLMCIHNKELYAINIHREYFTADITLIDLYPTITRA